MINNTHHSVIDSTNPVRQQASRRVTLVSVGVNFVAAIAQGIFGIIGHSQALVADAMHTISDMFTDALVLFALKHSAKAADAEHPYGHARIETAVTMVLGVMLFLVAVGIAVRAGIRLWAHEPLPVPEMYTLWAALFTIIAKEGLYRYTMGTANQFDSPMLRANAWHHRSDAISSVIVVIGIAGSLYGFTYFDSIAAIVVAMMVAKIGIELTWQAIRELIDTGLTQDELNALRRGILSVNGVRAIHMLRTRRTGGFVLADVHIIVDGALSVSEGHQISEAVRSKLIEDIKDVSDVMVHIDPEDDETVPPCEDLPLRPEVEARLKQYFKDIPEANYIEQSTLHYLAGKIQVDLVLSLSAIKDKKDVERMNQLFNAAVSADPHIKRVNLYFH